jgi:hypothetical protein
MLAELHDVAREKEGQMEMGRERGMEMWRERK